jgi:hypothetical protein
MPFGRKPGAGGAMIDFDAVYSELIAPAITAAGMEPIRADQELTGGIIHKPMFERLILCEFAVADLTSANANVFYELGLRHAVRPASTQLIFAEGTGQLPFDVALLRALPYKLGADGKPSNAAADSAAVAARLKEARDLPTDSPVFQLVEGFPDVARLKTDVFRDRVKYREEVKAKLAAARKQGAEAVRAVEASLGGVADQEAGVVIDLYLSYRRWAWTDMIALVPRCRRPSRQQWSASNWAWPDGLVAARKPSACLVARQRGPSMSPGISGACTRIAGKPRQGRRSNAAHGLLKQAIEAISKDLSTRAMGTRSKCGNHGLRDPPDPRRLALISVVAYAVSAIAAGKRLLGHATRLSSRCWGGPGDRRGLAGECPGCRPRTLGAGDHRPPYSSSRRARARPRRSLAAGVNANSEARRFLSRT